MRQKYMEWDNYQETNVNTFMNNLLSSTAQLHFQSTGHPPTSIITTLIVYGKNNSDREQTNNNNVD